MHSSDKGKIILLKMRNCGNCNSNLIGNHELEAKYISPMKNGSRIIEPVCRSCRAVVDRNDVEKDIMQTQRVVIISGTAGAGKSALGQFIEDKFDYVFIDGDAVSKKVNHMARIDPSYKNEEYLCHTETINTMLVTLGLGYNVVVGYVFDLADIENYRKALAKCGIIPFVRVLIPTRNVCIERDKERSCWTAGEEFVDKWFDSQLAIKNVHSDICVDNSFETIEETVTNHFEYFLV